jgi:hypothetical protein
MTPAAAIVDSRNVYHQVGDAIGVRARPVVSGVQSVFRSLGLDIRTVHIGLALARPSDAISLAAPHAENQAYRAQVDADPAGDVLLGQLHRKSNGRVEEKMVDGACCVRIARYVDEIAFGRTDIRCIVVVSKDIDLTPAIDYAVEKDVPIVVAASDVVQHRPHPWVLLSPHAYNEMTQAGVGASGHELRQLAALALADGKPLMWRVESDRGALKLTHTCGLTAVAAAGVTLPAPGQTVALTPVDVTWQSALTGSFPLLELAATAGPATWDTATVTGRPAPQTLEVSFTNGKKTRPHYPLGGVVPGDAVVVHRSSGRVVGQLPHSAAPRVFDPDLPQVVRVTSPLPRGGALAQGTAGRGLLVTRQNLVPGQRIPALQIDMRARGPVWVAIGTPLVTT